MRCALEVTDGNLKKLRVRDTPFGSERAFIFIGNGAVAIKLGDFRNP
jgi:hypothetical protein